MAIAKEEMKNLQSRCFRHPGESSASRIFPRQNRMASGLPSVAGMTWFSGFIDICSLLPTCRFPLPASGFLLQALKG
jgi:hypothetical protein